MKNILAVFIAAVIALGPTTTHAYGGGIPSLIGVINTPHIEIREEVRTERERVLAEIQHQIQEIRRQITELRMSINRLFR